ncbi:hypothetical protein OSTOST_22729, partial [Ostertagia ostertagi]
DLPHNALANPDRFLFRCHLTLQLDWIRGIDEISTDLAHRCPSSSILPRWCYKGNKKSWSAADVDSKAGLHGHGYQKERRVLGYSYIPAA